jgi:hypothetical protein
MDDALFMGRLERGGNLPRDRQSLVERNRSLFDPIGKRRPVNQFHDKRVRRATVFKAVNLGDVRMIERRKNLRFAMKAGEPVRIVGERTRENLQCDVTTEFRVAGAIHLAHTSRAKGGNDLVGPQTGFGGQRHEIPVRVSRHLR